MSILTKLRGLFAGDSTVQPLSETDVRTGDSTAKPTGGVPQPGAMDANSTTGTTPSGEFVGRAGSDETGDVGLSGAEARSDQPTEGRTGAARDE